MTVAQAQGLRLLACPLLLSISLLAGTGRASPVTEHIKLLSWQLWMKRHQATHQAGWGQALPLSSHKEIDPWAQSTTAHPIQDTADSQVDSENGKKQARPLIWELHTE